jgi:uncharacterized glyoxalase superfamily protein PhnB
MPVKPIPDGYHTITPYLVVRGLPKLLDFLKRAFGAEETERVAGKDGTPTHAEVKIGDSRVMMGEARPEHPPMPSMLYLYVADCDAAHRRAVAAGGTSILEPTDMFYGDRNGAVKDPCGNQWWIASRKENLSREEIARRAAAHR